jgi:hypothetical protein
MTNLPPEVVWQCELAKQSPQNESFGQHVGTIAALHSHW